jgi:hypothetical protein
METKTYYAILMLIVRLPHLTVALRQAVKNQRNDFFVSDGVKNRYR